MLWINNTNLDPALNLALEEALLVTVRSGHPGYAMLWQNAPTVVVGRFQNVGSEVDPDVIARRGIHIVRRMTGGGTVYHDSGTLNYSFIHYLEHSGRIPSFSEAGRPIAQALQGLGLDVDFSGRNDLMLAGAKVAGVAHCRLKDRFLHHGCLLISSDLDVLGQVLRPDPEKFLSKGVASVRSRVTNLSEHAPVDVERVRQAIVQHCGASLVDLDPAILEKARRLRDSKYADPQWTFGAAPPCTERKQHRFSWGKLEALLDVKNGCIAAIRLHGDVFGNLSGLETLLTGIPYTHADIRRVLDENPPELYIDGCRKEELLQFLHGQSLLS